MSVQIEGSVEAVAAAVDPVVDLVAEDMAARAAVLEARIAELEAATRETAIRGELKAEAVRAGMVDLDGLKLADTSTVTVDERGAVVGAAALMTSLRRAKPWLFGAVNSSSTAPVPPAEAPRGRMAMEMSHEEWQAGRKALMRR